MIWYVTMHAFNNSNVDRPISRLYKTLQQITLHPGRMLVLPNKLQLTTTLTVRVKILKRPRPNRKRNTKTNETFKILRIRHEVAVVLWVALKRRVLA